jgi:hypothetical protein
VAPVPAYLRKVARIVGTDSPADLSPACTCSMRSHDVPPSSVRKSVPSFPEAQPCIVVVKWIPCDAGVVALGNERSNADDIGCCAIGKHHVRQVWQVEIRDNPNPLFTANRSVHDTDPGRCSAYPDERAMPIVCQPVYVASLEKGRVPRNATIGCLTIHADATMMTSEASSLMLSCTLRI